jgi:tRNA(Ile)-lysidine synthase
LENLAVKDRFLTNKHIVLGLSGGVDSVFLLHYLQQFHPENLQAVYINHHLNSQANIWQEFCKNLCKRLNVSFLSIDIFLEGSSNIEENARKKRYHALSRLLTPNSVLCTAHHQNDQAETLLLQLFRGAGVLGLSAMPKLKKLKTGWHYRPLLNIDKNHILTQSKNHNLSWIEDDSNQNQDFKRNFIRNNILPELEKSYQNIHKTLARSAKHQAESAILNQDLAILDMAQFNILSPQNQLKATALKNLSTQRMNNVLRAHLVTLGFTLPSEKILQQIFNLIKAKNDASPLVCWGGFEVRRYQDKLYFINTQSNTLNTCEIYETLKHQTGFSMRFRVLGERVILMGKTYSQPLKKVLQEARIPPWEREKLHMYLINGELRAMQKIGYLTNPPKLQQ